MELPIFEHLRADGWLFKQTLLRGNRKLITSATCILWIIISSNLLEEEMHSKE